MAIRFHLLSDTLGLGPLKHKVRTDQFGVQSQIQDEIPGELGNRNTVSRVLLEYFFLETLIILGNVAIGRAELAVHSHCRYYRVAKPSSRGIPYSVPHK